MALQYLISNAAANTTAAPVKQPTGTAIRTMLQIKLAATITARIKKWWISFDGSAAATPGQVELVETGTVAATMSTALAVADITKYNADALLAGDPTTTLITFSTATTAFATAAVTEGSTTVARNLDAPQMVAPTTQFIYEFSLGNEPFFNALNYLRIRTTFGTTVNCYCGVVLEI